jgi:CRISPR/Cas system-associated protein Cas10 (large subunit of type III CRISPR-Cas system)
MSQDTDFRERVIERLTAVEGQLSSLAVQLEASDNSLRQLLRFDKERFGRIEAALEAFEKVIARSASKDDLEGLSARLGLVERRVETLEVQSHMGNGQKEFLLRVWAWVGPVLGAIVTAWTVRSLF